MDRRSLGRQRCPLLCLPCLFKRFCRIGLGLSNLIGTNEAFRRTFYVARRDGPVAFVEDRDHPPIRHGGKRRYSPP